jgi:sugar lactone lactonase YvrE
VTPAALAVDARADSGESPWWCRRSRTLLWVDIHGRAVHRFDPATGKDVAVATPDLVTFVAPHRDGGLIVALRDRIVHGDDALRDLVTVARPPLPEGQRLNDGAIDATGRLWIGAMDPAGEPRAALYRIDHDGRCEAKISGLRTVNGLAFSPDARTLYVSDSHPQVRTVWAYDVDAARGTLTGRRIFVDTRSLPGRPDGGCVDVDGCYWMAAVDGACLLRFAPGGRVVDRVDLPVEKPSKPAFGGGALRDLYVTSLRRNLARPIEDQPHAGGVFRVEVGVAGPALPECTLDIAGYNGADGKPSGSAP